MPELAEAQIMASNLANVFRAPAVEVDVLDPKVLYEGSDEASLRELLTGAVPDVSRRGKYILLTYPERTVIFHMGMSGTLDILDQDEAKYSRLRIGWGPIHVHFRDPRRFGHVAVVCDPGDHPVSNLGEDLYEITAEALQAACKRRMLKSALLDQSVVAGVGNIAISEVFWELRLAPDVRSHELESTIYPSLLQALRAHFDRIIAAESGENLTLMQHGGPNIFSVYGRLDQPCPRCEHPVERVVVSSRSTYYCAYCVGTSRE